MAYSDSSVFIAGRKKKREGVGGFISPEIQNKNIISQSKQLLDARFSSSRTCEKLSFSHALLFLINTKAPAPSSPLNCGFLSCGLKGVILG